MGIQADIVEYGTKSTIHLDALETALGAHPNDYYKAVLVTHVDTSTSVKNDIAAVRALMDDLGSHALLAVDCVASLGCDEFKMDAWGADVMVAACQKGLMVPAGMAFVYFNDKAAERQKQLPYVNSYWEWGQRANPEIWHIISVARPQRIICMVACCAGYDPGRGHRKYWERHEHWPRPFGPRLNVGGGWAHAHEYSGQFPAQHRGHGLAHGHSAREKFTQLDTA